MQIICTSLQTDNHASISSLIADALPDAQPTVTKALTAMKGYPACNNMPQRLSLRDPAKPGVTAVQL